MMSNLALLVAVLSLQAPAPAPAQTDALARAYYLFIQGRVLSDENDLAAAAAKFREALGAMPESAEIRAELAGLYAQQGELDRARDEATRALATEADNRSAHRILGLIEASSVQRPSPEAAATLDSAIGHLEASRTQGLRDPAVTLTLGQLYLRAGRHREAIDTLQLFLLDRPDYPQAVMLLAEAYRASGQPQMADALTDGAPSAGVSAEPSTRALELLEARGQWREAAVGWARLLEGNPRDVSSRLRYAAALVNSGDLERGRGEILALTRDEPTEIGAWHLLAQIEQRAGNVDAAEQAARKIAEIDPADARGPIALADLRADRQDYRGVVAALEARVAAPPESDVDSGMLAELAVRLADAHTELGDSKRAIRTLEGALARVPDDNQMRFSLAATYEQDRQFDRAERTFREVIASDPEHAPALNYLGYMLADRGRKLEEALGFIQRALVIDSDNPSFLDSLGWAYFRLERFNEAVAPLERAAAAVPRSSVIQEHLGDLYVKLSRHADAVAAFDRALAGDGDGIDAGDVTKKRDRARAASGSR